MEDLFPSLSFQNCEFYGVMRFFYQDDGSKVSTKCIRVAGSASTQDVLETLIEKFRPDMRMLSLPKYSLYEVHVNGGKSLLCLYFSGSIFFEGLLIKMLVSLQKSANWKNMSGHCMCN